MTPEQSHLMSLFMQFSVDANDIDNIIETTEKLGAQDALNFFDPFGIPPLNWAVANRHEAVVQLLLQHGANVNQADRRGRTPLYWAIHRNSVGMVALLLNNKANLFAGAKRKKPLDKLLEKPELCRVLATQINNNEIILFELEKHRDPLSEALIGRDDDSPGADFIKVLQRKIPQVGRFTKPALRM